MTTPVVGVDRVGVIGGGQMGAGIAEVCARAGLDVLVREVDAGRARAARERIEASLTRAVRKGELTQDLHDRLGRLSYTANLDDLGDRDLVIEAVIEDPEEKLTVHRLLDKVVPEHAILASNTSSIPIINIGMATDRADRVVGLHFFNPVPVLQLVEIVPSLRTSAETI